MYDQSGQTQNQVRGPFASPHAVDSGHDELLIGYQKQNVKALKELLKQKRLSRQGRKADLVIRLVESEIPIKPLAMIEQAIELSVPAAPVDSPNTAYVAVKDKLHADYMTQTREQLVDAAVENALPVTGTKHELAQRLAMHHLLINREIANCLCMDEDPWKTKEERMGCWNGVVAEVPLFTPGKVPLDFVHAAIQLFQQQQMMNSWYVSQLLQSCHNYFSKLPSLLQLSVPQAPPPNEPTAKPRLTVCGDTHGQFYDLLHIFELNGYPHRTNPYVMNGDFVDRGAFGVEVMLTLLLFKLYDPDCIHLLRGNHETRWMNSAYGFSREVVRKFTGPMHPHFIKVFQSLPLAAVIGEKVLVVHGGIPTDDTVMLDDLSKIERGDDPREPSLMFDLLWSDPTEHSGVHNSGRGVDTKRFGPDVTAAFLKRNKLDLLVRSHEVRMEGYAIEQEGKTITVFSAPNYRDRVKNKGAYIHFDKTMTPVFTQFDCVPHP